MTITSPFYNSEMAKKKPIKFINSFKLSSFYFICVNLCTFKFSTRKKRYFFCIKLHVSVFTCLYVKQEYIYVKYKL